MVNKSTIVAIILIMLAVGLIFIGVWITYNNMQDSDKQKGQSDQLFVISANGFYGIMDVDGNVVANAIFKNVSRVNDIIYLKNDTTSYMYNIATRETVSLDGKETEFIYIYNTLENTFEDKYILKYGGTTEGTTSGGTAIYRIVDAKGERVANKDFASVAAVYEYLDLVPEENFVPKDVADTVLSKDIVQKPLTYCTSTGKSQYVVKSGSAAESSNIKYGIVDEDNMQILPSEYDNIEQVKGSNKASIAKKGNKQYVVINTGKIIEIEEGFEVDVNDSGYIIQKIGDTANKVYNFEGDVILDTIFAYPAEMVVFDTESEDYVAMVDDKTKAWTLYNLKTSQKMENTFTNVLTSYLATKDKHTKNKTLIYSTGTQLVGVDLEKLTSYKISIPYRVVAPLESGYKLVAEEPVEQQQ